MRRSIAPFTSWILTFLVVATTATAIGLGSSSAQVAAPVVQEAQQPRDAAPAAKGTGPISGRVTNRETGGPLRRALIRITSPALASPRSVSTNSDGRYEVRDLPSGQYSLKAERGGYFDTGFRTAAASGAAQAAPGRRRPNRQGD